MVQKDVPGTVNQQIIQQSPVDPIAQNSPNISKEPVVVYTANEAINSLSLHVKKDFNDKMGDAIAYSYYIVGDSKILDNIEEVSYQRNHNSFSEYKNKSFIKSVARELNFSFKGYQWGYIETVYVYVVMKDKSKSEAILKTIIYDNWWIGIENSGLFCNLFVFDFVVILKSQTSDYLL